jgi:hypothetical protein
MLMLLVIGISEVYEEFMGGADCDDVRDDDNFVNGQFVSLQQSQLKLSQNSNHYFLHLIHKTKPICLIINN